MSSATPKRGALVTLLPYMKAHQAKLWLVFFLVVAVVVIELIQPWLVKEVIDRYVTVAKPDFNSILVMSSAYLGLVLVAFGLTYYQEVLLQRIGVSIVRSLRLDLFRHIQRLALRYFDQTSAGRIITNVVSDTEALNNFFTQFLSNTLRGIFSLLLIMFFMLRLDTVIALYCFLLVPPVVVTFTFRIPAVTPAGTVKFTIAPV